MKVGDRVHPRDINHPWEDTCCKVLEVKRNLLLVGNKPNGETQWFKKCELEHVSDFVMKYAMQKIVNHPEECFQGNKQCVKRSRGEKNE